MPGEKPLKAIVCDPDSWGRSALGQQIVDAGFELLGESTNAIEALQQVTYLHPTLVVMAHEQPGMSGLEAMVDMRRADDPPEVVLLSIDDTLRERGIEQGAFSVVVKGETDMFARILSEVRELLETGERRKSVDRRVGGERRQQQDWSKVTHERRSGVDRRGSLRREKDVTSTARENLARRRDEPTPD